MKKNLFLIGLMCLILIVGLTVVACGKGDSPSKVTTKLYAAMEKGDAKAIRELTTPEAAELMVAFLEKLKEGIAAKGGVANTEETIDGDTAFVITTFNDGSTEELELIKVNGKWKVTVNK